MSNSQLFVAIGFVAVAAASALVVMAIRRARSQTPTEPEPSAPVVDHPPPFAGIEVATTAITSLQPEDALLVCELDGLARMRVDEGDDAVEALQLQLGRHLGDRLLDDEVIARFEGDTFVVVLRAVHEPLERLMRRIIETWAVEHPARRLHLGGALHTPRSSPLDTAESARAALFAAQRQ